MSRRYITAQSIQSRVGAHNHAAVVCIEDISGGYRRKRKETHCCWFKQEMWNCAARGRIESWWRAAHPWNEKEQRVSLSYIISITAIFSAGLAAIRERQKRLCVWAPDTFLCVCCVYLIWLLFLLFFCFLVSALQWTSSNNPSSRREDNERTVQQPRLFLIVRHRLVLLLYSCSAPCVIKCELTAVPLSGPGGSWAQSRYYIYIWDIRQYRLLVIIKRRGRPSPIESWWDFWLSSAAISATHIVSGCCCYLLAAAAAAAQSVTYRMSHGWKPVRRFALKGIELYNRTEQRRRPFSVLLCLLRSISMCWALIISNEREKNKKEKRKTSNWQVDVRLTETNFVCRLFPRPYHPKRNQKEKKTSVRYDRSTARRCKKSPQKTNKKERNKLICDRSIAADRESYIIAEEKKKRCKRTI